MRSTRPASPSVAVHVPSLAARARRPLAAVVALSLGAAAVVAVGVPTASAASTSRNPVASTPRFAAAPGGLTITGWAFDPDAPTTNLRVAAVVDGVRTLGTTVTSLPNSGAVRKYGTGPTPGYSLTVPLDTAKHIVCVLMDNAGGGQRLVKKCVATPLGRVLTAAQKAKRSPKGAIQVAAATRSYVRVVGWASDPDIVSRKAKVVVYLNGQSAATRYTTTYAGTRPAAAGRSSRFDITVPATRATQIACVWVVNVGLGSNSFLGCRALDSRSPAAVPASTTPPAVPALNQKVVALALKQIGKPYVWGATGPRSFDCSGLVMWAYGKNKFQTPRVSQDQIKSARLIPAARAVPGDLVFYHDNVGDVYHVGVYLKPGLSVAAIDTDQGVDYQRIWDTTATYGSFTHT